MLYRVILLASVLTPIQPTGLPHVGANTSTINNILSIAFTVIGALAVLAIVVSGLRYVLAGGDPQKTSKAKNGIIFALVGLAVAVSAQAIVTYVIGNL